MWYGRLEATSMASACLHAVHSGWLNKTVTG